MAPIALRFLTLVLFFFTNGLGISARDLKVDLQDEKQVESKDEPYITQYAASYTTTKRNNLLSRPEKLSDPYTSGYNGYKTSPSAHKASQPNYIAGFRTHTHDSNAPYNTAYLGYTTHTHDNHEAKQTNNHDSNAPYNTAYLGYTTRTNDNHEAKQPNYIAGYRTHTHDSSAPYNTAYLGYTTRTHDNHEAKQTNYIAGYRTHIHDSSAPYNTAYLGYTSHTHDPNEVNQPYVAGYISTSHDSKAPTSTNLEDSKNSPSPDMDRTEAFKIGFFTLDDLYVGNVMTLQFPVSEVPPYLSRKEADSIPLSMSELPSVLQLFSIPEDSPEAKSMRRSLERCEDEPITGETKTCANSLESMLEFVDKVIGSDTKRNILTTSYPSPSASPLQKYTISEVSHDIDAPKWVACHPLYYPYAIHSCHFIATGTKMFKVSLVGENNGDKMEALGICHLDTSDWSPDHVIFRRLGIKPGKDAPVCHFFPVKHLMWIPQPSKATM